MKKTVSAVKDAALDAYLQPLYTTTSGEAVRAFTKEVNNPDSPINDTPSDYDLYELGTYDPQTGQHDNHETPQRLVRAKDVKRETT